MLPVFFWGIFLLHRLTVLFFQKQGEMLPVFFTEIFSYID